MTVSLVTGGNGYFGSLLVERLLVAGHTVRVLDIDPTGSQPDGVEVMVADIRDPAALRRAVAGVDAVFHNVAQVPLARDPALLRSVNVDGTVALLAAAARRAWPRSCTRRRAPCSGSLTTTPSANATCRTRSRPTAPPSSPPSGRACAPAADGLDVTIVRPRTILGHGRLGIFGILFDWIADGADPFVLGDGSNRYQFVHADDLARLCIAAAQAPGPDIFHAGTDRFGTMGAAIANLCEHAGTGAHVRSLPARPAAALMRATARLGLTPFAPYHWLMYGRSMWFDIEHARDRLGWTPRWSNDEMLADSYDWFVANRALATAGASGSRHRRSASSRLLGLLKSLDVSMPRPSVRRSPGAVVAVALMAALAYVPALMSSPGTMPADTKLYLYLDPRRLVSDSIWSFDARQFAGWVPHQVIAYLWPSGPWYVAAQAIGLPDWVAHRLWIGTIMFAAGTGIAWAVRRRLGFGLAAAVTAGLVYQLSPYLVPYVSRTSSMLLPWAGLGWVLGLTIGAADSNPVAGRRAVRAGDRHHRFGERNRPRDGGPGAAAVAAARRGRTHGDGPPGRRRRHPHRGAGDRHLAVVAGDAVDPGPPGRRPARLLGIAGGRQPHVDGDRGVAWARLLADVRARPVRPDHDRRSRLHDGDGWQRAGAPGGARFRARAGRTGRVGVHTVRRPPVRGGPDVRRRGAVGRRAPVRPPLAARPPPRRRR